MVVPMGVQFWVLKRMTRGVLLIVALLLYGSLETGVFVEGGDIKWSGGSAVHWMDMHDISEMACGVAGSVSVLYSKTPGCQNYTQRVEVGKEDLCCTCPTGAGVSLFFVCVCVFSGDFVFDSWGACHREMDGARRCVADRVPGLRPELCGVGEHCWYATEEVLSRSERGRVCGM
eukprot:639152-Hanusia_phi.AAC.5